MIKVAAKAGIKPLEFWELTPAELIVSVEALAELKTESLKENITIAYMNAAWGRSKTMPKLNNIIDKLEKADKSKPKKQQTDNEMYAIAVAVTQQLKKRGESVGHS
jgi:hypothetical protein